MIIKVGEKYGSKKCFGTLDSERVYKWNTYNDSVQNAKNIGSAIIKKNLAPKY